MIGVLLHGRVWWRIHEKRSRLWVERCIGELARELVHPNVHLAAISFLSIEGCSGWCPTKKSHLILLRKLDRLIWLEKVPVARRWDGNARTASAQALTLM